MFTIKELQQTGTTAKFRPIIKVLQFIVGYAGFTRTLTEHQSVPISITQ